MGSFFSVMKIAIYARISVLSRSENFVSTVEKLLKKHSGEVWVWEAFSKHLSSFSAKNWVIKYYSNTVQIPESVEHMFVFGGDGTFLDASLHTLRKKIALVGINYGRLGFLTCLKANEIEKGIEMVLNKEIIFQKRCLLEVSSNSIWKEKQYALNDFYITKRSTNTMIETEVYSDDEYLNVYNSDGLIISTPTGSTGYSLSCGGPIVHNASKTLLVTPVSPHNLNVRPVVVANDVTLCVKVKNTRNKSVNVSLDARNYILDGEESFIIQKAPFSVLIGQKKDESFYQKLKDKLYWGQDNRK